MNPAILVSKKINLKKTFLPFEDLQSLCLLQWQPLISRSQCLDMGRLKHDTLEEKNLVIYSQTCVQQSPSGNSRMTA